MHICCETPRLLLRAGTRADLDQLVELENDPAVMRFINGGRPTSREAVRNGTLARLLRHHPYVGDRGAWIAEERFTGDFLGWFALRPLDEHNGDVVELGYRLRTAAWGRGYATEGSRALVRRGFTALGAQRITANTMTVNTASRRVLEKTGLRWVRTFFATWPEVIEGSEQGDVEYELTRESWQREQERRAARTP